MLLILMVLKYLLIAVAVLLLLLLVLLLFLLFYPFHYKLEGRKAREEKNPEGEFHLRFPALHFRGDYKDRKLHYIGKILFFTILERGEE